MTISKSLTNSLFVGLTLLNLSIAGIAKADPNSSHGKVYIPMMDASFPKMSVKYKMNVTPFNLVFLAFQGFFDSEGIPSSQALAQSYRDGKVVPKTLVQAAIKMNRLSADYLNNQNYLNLVKNQLDDLNRNN